MKLIVVPASRGALWVRQGFQTFFARPLAFMGLFGVMLLAMLLAQLIPWVGVILFWAALPLITLGFMIATQQVLQGRFPTPQVFIAPLRADPANARALWQLGLLYAGAMLVVISVYVWIDGGRIDSLRASMISNTATPETIEPLLFDPRLQLSVIWFAAAAGLLSLPFWHAPALVHWGRQSVAKALFFSTVACWRNKGAFTVYALTGMAVVSGFAIVSSMLFAILGQPNLAVLAMMPGVLMFTTVFYASLFFTFADCFEMNPKPSDDPQEPAP